MVNKEINMAELLDVVTSDFRQDLKVSSCEFIFLEYCCVLTNLLDTI
jgi:hypothetical protein